METLTVKQGEIIYVLYNLTDQRVRELQEDPQKLATYFNSCIQSGSNVCISENEGTSTTDLMHSSCTSASSAANGQKKQKFSFLCGTFKKKNFIYAVKFGKHPWHYFDERHMNSCQHSSLPTSMDAFISKLDKVRSIDITLNEVESKNYFDNHKFIFKNKDLKTYMELFNKQPSQSNNSQANETLNPKSSQKSSHRLVFISGQTNPLMFLNDFEKCSDLKTDKEKMYKILHFVDECHKAEFTKLYFTSNWPTVRSAFLQMYSLSFVRNKKTDLHIDFNEANTLRSFMERKLMSLTKFTTLPFINQVEIAMNDLPVEISSLFIVNEKMTCDKTAILEFCDSIEDLVSTMRETEEPLTNENDQESNQPVNRMEVFKFIPESECEVESVTTDDVPEPSSRGNAINRLRGRGQATRVKETEIRKRGRPRKNIAPIPEEGESSDYDFMNQIDNSSRSSWSDIL